MSARDDTAVEPAESGARPTVVDIVAPVAVSAALQVGINPQAMGIAVAIGCSTAFRPTAWPVCVTAP